MLLQLTESTLYYRDLALAIFSAPATFDDVGTRIKAWNSKVTHTAPDSASATSRSFTTTSKKSALTAATSVVSSAKSSQAHAKPTLKPKPSEPYRSLRDEEDSADQVEREAESIRHQTKEDLMASTVSIAQPLGTSTRVQDSSTGSGGTTTASSLKRKLSEVAARSSDEEASETEDVVPYEPHPDDNADADAGDYAPQDDVEMLDDNNNIDSHIWEGAQPVHDPAFLAWVYGKDYYEGADEDIADKDGAVDTDSNAPVGMDEDSGEAQPDGDEDQQEGDEDQSDGDEGQLDGNEDHPGANEDQPEGGEHQQDGDNSQQVVEGEQGGEGQADEGEDVVGSFGRKSKRTTATTNAKASKPRSHRTKRMKTGKTSAATPAEGSKGPTKPTVNDLPPECQQQKSFSVDFMPTLCVYMGALPTPWGPSDDIVEEACAAIFRVIYKREFSALPQEQQTAVLSIACDRLYLWRNNFSSTAVAALLVLMGARKLFTDEERTDFAKRLLVGGAFLYEKIVDGKLTNIFHGSYFTIVLSCHFNAIKGHYDVPAHAEQTGGPHGYLPLGAFALAAAACVRAIRMIRDGQLAKIDKAMSSITEAGCTPENGWAAVCKARRLITESTRKPRSSKAKGRGKKAQANTDAEPDAEPGLPSYLQFSEANYGAETDDFHTSALRAGPVRTSGGWEIAISHVVNHDEDEEEDAMEDDQDEKKRGPWATLDIQICSGADGKLRGL
ncbi:hypothetical protein CONPUDRAFT_150433 [Coniophora puteana RWD-64-598 SS2]|uniref:Uncharacterized protein n=1 Tax=Coniophora puteana (strain RWD-64-598) TaxID=741705 RepID=A0A5M3N2L2_CONPW|nr:uncharacterized protein CONPUDRAFT_150433 [Coniophora puteana RWD-64-598 SS2]EIW85632.1 hypothetical protein CONPUDRAFT_150433 [Coniophora puteana RWD-64-598 SS2]